MASPFRIIEVSIAAAVANDQQVPHVPWSFILVIFPSLAQFFLSGKLSLTLIRLPVYELTGAGTLLSPFWVAYL